MRLSGSHFPPRRRTKSSPDICTLSAHAMILGDGFELPVSGKRHVKIKVLLDLL
jgi:hypothetical protein